MSYLEQQEKIWPLVEGSDYWDCFTVTVPASLREVVVLMLSYEPWWVRWLMHVRGVLAKVLRLKHEDVFMDPITPNAVPFTQGDRVAFWKVLGAEEERYWLAEVDEDHHLAAQLGVVAEPLSAGVTRYHMVTLVQYKDWTGPLYFNMIRPFHCLIASCMCRWVKVQLRG